MRQFITCIIICMALHSAAQTKKCKISFVSTNNVALIEGEAKSTFGFQTKNGVQYNSWFVGVGSGFDYYQKRTIPLFLSLQKDFFKGNKKLFVYTDGGINFRWLQSSDYFYKSSTSTPGLYYEFGFGHRVILKNNSSVNLSLGYSLKQVKESNNPFWYIAPVQDTNPDYTEKYNSNFRRIILRLGFTL